MPSAWTPELVERIRSRALASGFDLAGVSPAHPAEAPEATQTAARFTEWIDLGRAGEMDYLKRRNDAGELLRNSARTAIPWARSLLVCALNYNLPGIVRRTSSASPSRPASPNRCWIARYAWTADALPAAPLDYHDDHPSPSPPQVESALLLESQASLPDQAATSTPVPILERDFAARAGIGWIGKNTCVLNQQHGSWLLLGVILTSPRSHPGFGRATLSRGLIAHHHGLESATSPPPRPLRLLYPLHRRLPHRRPPRPAPSPDGRQSRCIAYLTIEKKGDIPSGPSRSHRPPRLRLRHLPGSLPLEQTNPSSPKHEPGSHPPRRNSSTHRSTGWPLLTNRTSPPSSMLFAGSPLERTQTSPVCNAT